MSKNNNDGNTNINGGVVEAEMSKMSYINSIDGDNNNDGNPADTKKRKACDTKLTDANNKNDCNLVGTKKGKVCDTNLMLFRAEIPPSSFKLLIENISHVIKSLELHIVDEEDFKGIRVETLDDLKVCLVIAQLPCEIQMSDEWKRRSRQSVTISIECLLITLRQVETQYSLIIEQFVGNEDVVQIRSFESLTGEDELLAHLHSLVPVHNGTIKMKKFPVKYKLEMDLQTVRGFLKTCESIKSDDVVIIVTEYLIGDANTIETVTIKACEKARISLQRTFKDVRDETKECDLTNLQGGQVIFSESFSTKYLNNFMRSMNRTNVMLHMSPKNPIHVSYSLGTRDAHVRFILAPRETVD